jgi:hypothetical protein
MPTSTTDTVIQAATATSVEVIGDAPGFAMGSVFQAAGQAFALMMQNAAATQHGLQQVQIATVATSVAKIMSMAPDKNS